MPSVAVESLHVRLSDLFQHRIRLKNNDHSAWATILFTSALCVASYWSSITGLSEYDSSSFYVNMITIILPLCPIVWFEVKLLFYSAISSRRSCRNHRLDYVPPVATSSCGIAWRSLIDAFFLIVLLPSFLVRFSGVRKCKPFFTSVRFANTIDCRLAPLCNQVDCLWTCHKNMGNDFGLFVHCFIPVIITTSKNQQQHTHKKMKFCHGQNRHQPT